MTMPKPSLFSEEERGNRRAKIGDPLVGLSAHVDFVALATGIDTASPRPSRAKGGRPPYPTVLMIKILVLQQLYNLADDTLEYQLLDRRSFLQFLGLTDSSTVPGVRLWRRSSLMGGVFLLEVDMFAEKNISESNILPAKKVKTGSSRTVFNRVQTLLHPV